MRLSIHCDRCKATSELTFKDTGALQINAPAEWSRVWVADYAKGSEVINVKTLLCESCMTHYHNTMKEFLHIGKINEDSNEIQDAT